MHTVRIILLALADSNLRGVQRDRTCYGATVPDYYMGETWTVDNPSVATADGSGSDADVRAVGGGTANVRGHWTVYTYTSVHDLEFGPHCEVEEHVTEPRGPVQVVPVRFTRVTQAYGTANFSGIFDSYNATLSLPSNSPPCTGTNAFDMKVYLDRDSSGTLYPRTDPRNFLETDADGQFRINGGGLRDETTSTPYFEARLQRITPGNTNKPIRFGVGGFTSTGTFIVRARVTITCN